MRKNNMRKWFHLIIDFIPLFIIPIFAININQKSVEPISVEVQEQINVDFNQYVQNGNVATNEYWSSYQNNATFVYGTNEVIMTTNGQQYNNGVGQYINVNKVLGQKWLVKFVGSYRNLTSGTPSLLNPYMNGTFTYNLINLTTTPTIYEQIFSITRTDDNGNNFYIFAQNGTNNNVEYVFSDFQLFNLTQMFGIGNEPTIQEFNNYFNDLYYNYTESQKMLINKPTPTTYDSTDIGSQFVYALYKPVHDYFNISELGGFNQFYQWIEINFFNGTAPLPFFIVFNIMMYNFIIDMIFLLYSVFMFIIDFAENCLNRFYPR